MPTTAKGISFAQNINGKLADLFILKNCNGLEAGISNYGARWISMLVPDSKGQMTNVIAGFETIDAYMDPSAVYYGATIGRYANRIENGIFTLDNISYTLERNNGNNHLHGGVDGFHSRVWDVVAVNKNSVLLKYLSPDSEEGYPGNLEALVRYTLTDSNEMKIEFTASTDKQTIINLTNHAYFNLNGACKTDILDHELMIHADAYTPVKSNLIPTGEIASVEGTPFDFRRPQRIGACIDNINEQLSYGQGYDHNFVLAKEDNDLAPAAILTGDISHIQMEVLTTEPGMQLYTGNFMNGSNVLSNGTLDRRRTAVCLETQHFPDSPNQKNFPSTVLLPGMIYQSTSIFRFSIGN